jgi:hypothetical protein
MAESLLPPLSAIPCSMTLAQTCHRAEFGLLVLTECGGDAQTLSDSPDGIESADRKALFDGEFLRKPRS